MARQLTVDERSIYDLMKPTLKLEEITDIKEIGVFVKTVRYTVDKPVAYRIDGTDSILVFGGLKNSINIEQLRKMYQTKMGEMKEKEDDEVASEREEKEDANVGEPDEKEAEAAHGNDGSSSVKEEDIKLIQSQISAKREDIIQALTDSGNDVVTAMMKLSK
jgi:nascent polypeptide-associated complex subunit alpha